MGDFKRGKMITSLDQLADCKYIYFMDKVIHHGFWQNWQLRLIINHINMGRFWEAELKKPKRIGENAEGRE